VRTLNFLLQGRSRCGFFPHSVNYSCLYQTSVYLPLFEYWGKLVQWLATGWTGIESQWGVRFSALVQTAPWAQPAFCMMDTRFLPRGEVAGVWQWPPTLIQHWG
jgi:hypothetical protein